MTGHERDRPRPILLRLQTGTRCAHCLKSICLLWVAVHVYHSRENVIYQPTCPCYSVSHYWNKAICHNNSINGPVIRFSPLIVNTWSKTWSTESWRQCMLRCVYITTPLIFVHCYRHVRLSSCRYGTRNFENFKVEVAGLFTQRGAKRSIRRKKKRNPDN